MCSGITWMTKNGLKKPNYWGSITQSGTLRVGNYEGEEVYTPFKSLVPMVNPNDIVLGGWDISGLNMAEGMERAKVLDFELQRQLVPYMKDIVPLPGGCQCTHVQGAAAMGSHGCAWQGRELPLMPLSDMLLRQVSLRAAGPLAAVQLFPDRGCQPWLVALLQDNCWGFICC